jgi:hypothetical protein
MQCNVQLAPVGADAILELAPLPSTSASMTRRRL